MIHLTILVVVALLLLTAPATAQEQDPLARPLAPHPRLFADDARFASLKKQIQADPTSAHIHSLMVAQAEHWLSQPLVSLEKTGRRLLGPAQHSQVRILTFSLLHSISPHPRYRDRALDEMRNLAKREDWNPSHFLDTAEAAFAIAVGYDWLYSELSDEDRALFETAIIEKGLKPSFETGNTHWVTNRNNWNQVCHGGLSVGALAIADRDPEIARQILTRAITNIPFGGSAYAPDGVYPEGPGYWEYGTTFHVILADALRTGLGSTFDLEKFPGFLQSPRFVHQMLFPTGRVFNYADNGDRRGFHAALFWFARQLKDPSLAQWERNTLAEYAENKRKPPIERSHRVLPLALIWWNPADLANPAPDVSPSLNYLGKGRVPLAIHRTAFNDPNAVVIALKAGSASVSHGHMDAGSFILEADNVRWAVDLGAQDYHSLESKGVRLWDGKQTGQRWEVFVLGSDAHNILRFNNAPQLVSGAADITRFDPDKSFSITELTSIYKDQIASARRGLRLLPDRRVLIRDEWTALADKPADVAFQWLTFADATVNDDKSVTLSQSDKTLTLKLLTSADNVTVTIEDASQPVRDYDRPNPGLKRIVLRTTTPAGSNGAWTLLASPQSATTTDPVPVVELDQW